MKKAFVLVTLFVLPLCAFSQESDLLHNADVYKSRYSSPFAQPKFVPDISLIADFSYASRNYREEDYRDFEIPGFMDAHNRSGVGGSDGIYAFSDTQQRGFNLNYGELNLQAAVDPYFDLFSNFALSESTFEIEELYITSKSFPLNLQVKLGKFFSSFGRLNAQHEHHWDFADMPVVNNVFFGDGLLEKGVHISWLAPLDFYLLIGGEILQGENEASFGSDGFYVTNTGLKIKGSDKPNVYTGFIKTSWDIDDFVVLAGLSSAVGKTISDYTVNEDDGYAIDACTGIYGGDLTLKYLIDSYRYISFQGEYLYRHMNGSEYAYDGSKFDLKKEQSGMYAQLVVRPFMQWRFGMRYDFLHMNEIYVDNVRNPNAHENLDRFSFMIEYNPSEFARFRLQYNQDRTKYLEDDRKIVNEIVLECNFTIGAHGAHKF